MPPTLQRDTWNELAHVGEGDNQEGGVPIMEVQWIKCEGDVWCPLMNLDLSKVGGHGVYIIWHEGNPSRVVRVGMGSISDRLAEHRREQDILVYADIGTLRVTWAELVLLVQPGIERFLFDTLRPLVGERAPDVDPTPVNLPW